MTADFDRKLKLEEMEDIKSIDSFTEIEVPEELGAKQALKLWGSLTPLNDPREAIAYIRNMVSAAELLEIDANFCRGRILERMTGDFHILRNAILRPPMYPVGTSAQQFLDDILTEVNWAVNIETARWFKTYRCEYCKRRGHSAEICRVRLRDTDAAKYADDYAAQKELVDQLTK